MAAIASFALPVFYSEAADSSVQPDHFQQVSSGGEGGRRRKRSRSRSSSGGRSRSPLADEDAEGQDAKQKFTQTHEAWKLACREMYWRLVAPLLSRSTTDLQALPEGPISSSASVGERNVRADRLPPAPPPLGHLHHRHLP